MISQVEEVLKDQKRITPKIIQNIVDMARDRRGVMIFTSSVNHAVEIMQQLPKRISALVTGETPADERDEIIDAFKAQQLKFLVNVSVLTTGFDAPHVDVIAILRPTESVSLYQQIIGRGLRLSPEKTDCLILDYTGQGHDLYSPLIEENKPNSQSTPVEVFCPQCGVENQFWGIKDEEGIVIEHYGRKCRGVLEDPFTLETQSCGYLFRFKRCDQCGEENDISARSCRACQHILVDNDKKLKEAMALKDAHIMRVDSMVLQASFDKKKNDRLEVNYYDADAEVLKEYFYLDSKEDSRAFYFNFMRSHLKLSGQPPLMLTLEEAIRSQKLFRPPMFVIARKQKHFWSVREKIFDD